MGQIRRRRGDPCGRPFWWNERRWVAHVDFNGPGTSQTGGDKPRPYERHDRSTGVPRG